MSDIVFLGGDTTPRYKYCLFVDQICLEAVEHMDNFWAVVKLIHPDWEPYLTPEELLQEVHPPYHDGITEHYEEDVGWMYMELSSYVEKYEHFHEDDWNEMYVRPPFITCSEDENSMVGHWSKGRVYHLGGSSTLHGVK
jgi:hypothetical protein